MSSERLFGLAKSRAPADRERLLMAILDLCNTPRSSTWIKAGPIQNLLNSIFISLIVEAERDVRRHLSEKLAHADWAPPALINVLALDEIEIAAPIIAASPVLQDTDLVRLMIEATVEHQIEVARRPQLEPAAVSTILEKAEPAVLTTLAGNTTAELSLDDMRQLVEISRQVASLRTPLSRHPRLTRTLAERLYLWVGLAQRQSLAERFSLDKRAIAAALAKTQNGVAQDGETAMVTASDGEHQEMERRLIDKLQQAGQLRPGYLVRTLREGRLSLFATTLAMLGSFQADHIRRALDSDRPELLALACAAAGIDRSVFPAILKAVRELNAGRPDGGDESARRAAGAFGPVTPEVAGQAFRQAACTL